MPSLNLLGQIAALRARIEQLERGVAIGDATVTNAKLATMAQARIKGRASGAGTGAPTDLTGTQATAILDNFVGDSGSGGTKGLVPAPAAGDAAADKYLKANGSWATVTGGSGDSTESTAVGSETLTGTGDLNLYSNGYHIARYNGSAWITWGPIFPMTKPVDGDFSWVNQGGASVSTTNGGIHLNAPASASQNMRIRAKTAPSTPYSITAWFAPKLVNTNYTFFSFGFRDSSTGRMHHMRFGYNSAVSSIMDFAVVRSSGATADVSADVDIPWSHESLFCWRIADDGTNITFSYSTDGVNFIDRYSVGRTTYTATPDQVFFAADTRTASYPAGVTLLSWKEA